jgi:hypothetical protein
MAQSYASASKLRGYCGSRVFLLKLMGLMCQRLTAVLLWVVGVSWLVLGVTLPCTNSVSLVCNCCVMFLCLIRHIPSCPLTTAHKPFAVSCCFPLQAVAVKAVGPPVWEPGNNRRVVVPRPGGALPGGAGSEVDLVLGLLQGVEPGSVDEEQPDAQLVETSGGNTMVKLTTTYTASFGEYLKVGGCWGGGRGGTVASRSSSGGWQRRAAGLGWGGPAWQQGCCSVWGPEEMWQVAREGAGLG